MKSYVYSSIVANSNVPWLMQTHYVLLLCSFKEQLQQHVRVHAMEAVMACWEIEQSLQSLTGTMIDIDFLSYLGKLNHGYVITRAASTHT